MRGGVAASFSLLAAAAAVGGCGERTIDEDELEASLKRQLDRSAGVTSRAVRCPDDVGARRGRTFACMLVAPNGDEVRVDVRLTDDEGGFSANVAREELR